MKLSKGGNDMSNNYVNRKKICATIDRRLVPALDSLHSKTRVPKTRLLDEAIEDLLKKYNIEMEREK